jgi:hypothetical protein
MGHFKGFFEGAKTFLPLNCPLLRSGQLRLWKSWGSLKISREIAHKLICPKTKNNIPNFQNQQFIGNFMSPAHNFKSPRSSHLTFTVCLLTELAYTLSFDCWQIYIFADFLGEWDHCMGHKVFWGELNLCTAYAHYVQLMRKCGRLGN